jgi:hypothetical protein
MIWHCADGEWVAQLDNRHRAYVYRAPGGLWVGFVALAHSATEVDGAFQSAKGYPSRAAAQAAVAVWWLDYRAEIYGNPVEAADDLG